MIQADKPIKPFIEFVAEYIVKTLKGKSPDDIVCFYIDKFIFRNPKIFDNLVKYYKLPTKDFMKMHKRLGEIME